MSQAISPSSVVNSTDEPIGLLAAWGNLPLAIAETLRRQGRRVVCMAIRDHADPALFDVCDACAWMGVARFGRAVRFFRSHGVRQATMAGKFHKVALYRPGLVLRHFPDLAFLREFYPFFVTMSRDRNDDSLLGAICAAFARHGVQFGPATDFAPDLLADPGVPTRRKPTAREWNDVAFGWKMAKEMGRLDIGQSVAVKDRAVLAVEAIEGTDRCITRAGELCPVGGFTVVKTAKPQQDMRFDVPTIGRQTMENLIAAGGKCLAVEAGMTILLEEEDVLRLANRAGVAIVVIHDAEEAVQRARAAA